MKVLTVVGALGCAGLVVGGVLSAQSLAGCSASPKLVGQGGDCYQATDCADGLICAPQKSGGSICTNDLSGVQSTEPGAMTDAGDAGPKDGAGDVTIGPPDSGPPQDSGQPQDSGGD